MAFSRYTTLSRPEGVTSMSGISSSLRSGIKSGSIEANQIVLDEGKRLDHLAGQYYGDASYWWIIAASSGIGWCLQVPPGTAILIPRDLDAVLSLVI